MATARGSLLAPGSRAPQPVEPVRQYSFTDFQVNNPASPPPGDRLDAEIDRTNAVLGDTIDWAATSLNTDGTLRPGSVGEQQLKPGLLDGLTDGAVAELQPLVEQVGSFATQAFNFVQAASAAAVLSRASAVQADQKASDAAVFRDMAVRAGTDAEADARSTSSDADRAENAANHADGSEAVAQAYANVGMAWAEHMPDIIPPNILAVQAVTGDHWSSRWWANRAAETLSEMESLLLTIPPLAVVYYYTYIATAGQTIFTGGDRDGKVLTYTPGPQQTLMVFANGVLRTPVNDYIGTANTVTFTAPRAAGDIVQIQVEGVGATGGGGSFLPLTGGTMLGPITLAADPAGPLQPVTRQYADAKYLTFAGGTLTGPLTLSGNPAAALHAVPRQWLDANFQTTAQGDARWVNASGDTLIGPLILAGDPGTALGAATRQYVDNHQPLGGPYLPLSGGTLANLTVSGATTLNGATAANLTVSGASTLAGLTVTGITSLAGTVAGSLTVTGSTTLNAVTAGVVNGTSLAVTGGISAGTAVTANTLRGSNAVGVGDGTQQMYQPTAGIRRYAFSNGWTWDWDAVYGNLTWETDPQGPFIQFVLNATPAPFYRGINWLGPWQGAGAYIDASDERLKTDITDAAVGLPEALAIQPIRFRRRLRDGTVSPRFEIGFSARRLEGVIPEAVVPIGSQDKEGPGSHASGDPFLGITIEPVVAALLNAVKTLTARITELEAGAGAATGTQPKGSIWMRTDGAAGSTLYVTQGGGAWAAVAGV